MITDITKKPEPVTQSRPANFIFASGEKEALKVGCSERRFSALAAEDQSVPLTRAESFRVYATLLICFGVFIATAFAICN